MGWAAFHQFFDFKHALQRCVQHNDNDLNKSSDSLQIELHIELCGSKVHRHFHCFFAAHFHLVVHAVCRILIFGVCHCCGSMILSCFNVTNQRQFIFTCFTGFARPSRSPLTDSLNLSVVVGGCAGAGVCRILIFGASRCCGSMIPSCFNVTTSNTVGFRGFTGFARPSNAPLRQTVHFSEMARFGAPFHVPRNEFFSGSLQNRMEAVSWK